MSAVDVEVDAARLECLFALRRGQFADGVENHFVGLRRFG